MSKQKYYLVEWPESQPYIGNKDCIQSEGMSFFVPCNLIDNENSRIG